MSSQESVVRLFFISVFAGAALGATTSLITLLISSGLFSRPAFDLSVLPFAIGASVFWMVGGSFSGAIVAASSWATASFAILALGSHRGLKGVVIVVAGAGATVGPLLLTWFMAAQAGIEVRPAEWLIPALAAAVIVAFAVAHIQRTSLTPARAHRV